MQQKLEIKIELKHNDDNDEINTIKLRNKE